MQYFCTLFNSNYLSRGLAMYHSLDEHTSDFHLFILAFDDTCYDILQNLCLKNVTIIALKDFENPELLSVKSSRSLAEYCWTCTPFTIWYCIHNYSLDHCTYLDSDLLFFSDPKQLTEELASNSVLITEHRYSPEYNQADKCGIYCVQFMCFKNTETGLKVLNWWKNACLEWCYNRFEDGKFGDQKYLDDWTERFQGVHVLKHIGGGVAPWNNNQYMFQVIGNKLMVKFNAKLSPLVFYHFHDFRYCAEESYRLTNEHYILKPQTIKLIYSIYCKALQRAEEAIVRVSPQAVFREQPIPLNWVKAKMGRTIIFRIKGSYRNYYKKRKIKTTNLI